MTLHSKFYENSHAQSKKKEDEKIFKILMLGDASVGKTCLVNRFVENRYTGKYKCTIGIDTMTRTIQLSGGDVKLQIWDSAGEERFHCMTTTYYRQVQGIILVYDTTNKNSYNHVDYWMSEIKKYAASDVKIMLVGNKCDIPEKRQVPQERAQLYGDAQGIPYIETSAITGANVDRIFFKLAVSIFDAQKAGKPKSKKALKGSVNLAKPKNSYSRFGEFCC